MPVPEEDPNEIDYRLVHTEADAILYVYFEDVGFHSSAVSAVYLPKVNINGALRVKGEGDDFYNEDFRYGVDARAGESWAIAADPRLAFPSFEALIAKAPEIRELLEAGTQALGRRMAADLKAALK